MSMRQLLAGAAVLVVLVTAVWYVALAPSRQPSDQVRVTVTATATGSGSWVRYLVTVKNLADGDFAGDVLLIQPEDELATAQRSGQPLTSLGQAPQLPQPQSVAGQSAYQVRVSVPSRKSRTITVLAPESFAVVQAVMGGRILDEQSVDRSSVLPVAVLSEQEGPAGAIAALHYDRFSTRVASFTSARTFPSTPILLAGFAAVVVDQFDTATLSEAQLHAVRDFVGFGGTLLLGSGSSWRKTIAPLPPDLTPIRPQATADVSLQPMAQLAGVPAADVAAPAAVGTLAPGARRVLTTADGVPLIAELDYGAGRVVQLAIDPSGEAAGTPYGGLAWSQALARALQVQGAGPVATALLGPDRGFTALLPSSGDAPLPSPLLVGAVLLLYIGLVGPAAYFLVYRRLGRPGLMWVAIPAAAALFTSIFYLVGTSLQGTLQDSEIQVLRVGPGQAVNVLEYHRVLFLRRGDHRIDPGTSALVAPLTLDTYQATGSVCERCVAQLGSLPSGSERVISAQQPTVFETGVLYGSVRVVATSTTGRAPVGLDARLDLRGGHVQGTVANASSEPVAELMLYSADGQTLRRARLAELLQPGGRVSVDVALEPDRAGQGGPQPPWEELLLRAVAVPSLAQRGQAVLVGLTTPLPSQLTVDGERPPRWALAVLQQPVTVASADGPARDFQRRSLASTAGDSRSGYLDVYDIQVPATSAPLRLAAATQSPGDVEVFDWLRNAFTPSSAVGPGRATVLGSEHVRDGLVRVRVREPRLTWGAALWIESG